LQEGFRTVEAWSFGTGLLPFSFFSFLFLLFFFSFVLRLVLRCNRDGEKREEGKGNDVSCA
jgi:hypothetical protein